ncbi:hypothetical protein PV325_011440 [Microctonus aethiopoides]|nr:hypothetical protein PV325_011440 [Microctonus aethiopoides]
MISSILYCGSQESGVRDSSTSPSNGPVEEVRGRRGLQQTSWEAQLPVDHADPTDRTIFVSQKMSSHDGQGEAEIVRPLRGEKKGVKMVRFPKLREVLVKSQDER